jgi:hypothetical protein
VADEARFLGNLATVLACKFAVRWSELEASERVSRAAGAVRSELGAFVAFRGGALPATWQSVHDYASALNSIEPTN